MAHNYEYHFEIKPGKLVFVPTDDCMKRGLKIVQSVRKVWTPNQVYYHFGKRGGHVAAMRLHMVHQYFAKIDLTQFFTSVTRTKVVRGLRGIGFSNKNAFEIAFQSVVEHSGKKYLPYGFVQSMALATVCVEQSALGSKLLELNGANILASMYVDDIIISSNDHSALQTAYDQIQTAIELSNFSANPDKCMEPSEEIQIFNCTVSKGTMTFTDERMDKFSDDYASGSSFRQEAIARYMHVVNKAQLDEMLISFL